jgi:hypothetical protein
LTSAKAKQRKQAVGYIRTSSTTNVGADKDSEKRQRLAIERFARGRIEIVGWFNDPAVRGTDPIEARPGFSALLDRIEGNGVKSCWSRMQVGLRSRGAGIGHSGADPARHDGPDGQR